MSFFGFDTSLPRDRQSQGADRGIFEAENPFTGIAQARKLQAFHDDEDEILDFDDTYDGLGDQLQEAGDDFNDDTFGGGAVGEGQGAVGKDFDFFGNTAQYSGVMNEESVRYSLQHQPQPTASSTDRPRRTGYEKYQDPGFIGEIQSKSSAWSHKPQQAVPAADSAPERISTARAQTAQRKMMSLEEVEAAIRGQPPTLSTQQHMPPTFQQHQQPPIQPFPVQQYPPPQHPHQAQMPLPNVPQQHGRVPSHQGQNRSQQPLQILQNPNRSRHSPQPSQEQIPGQHQPIVSAQEAAIPVITHPQQLMELSDEQRKAYLEEDAKRAKRNHKIFLLSKGNGLMTPQDKNFITRIQLQQLVAATGNSADPSPEASLAEDFYYQVYSQIRGAPRQHPTQPLGHFAQTYLLHTGGRNNNRGRHTINGDNHMQRMQQQVQRAVEAAKLKPKNKQLIIEGSLGKISFSNAKTPKPLLNIKRQESSDLRPLSQRKDGRQVSPSDRKTILKNIEAVYTTLMKMEDHERKMPPPPPEDDSDAIQAHAEWRAGMQELNNALWHDMKVLDPIVPGSTVTHPFIAFLSYSKGKKAVPRIFRHIDQEQRVTILTMIVVHLDQLDVIRGAKIAPGESQPPIAIREEIELFSQTVMPSLLSYVSEAPINIMVGLLGLLIDHTNVFNVAQSKIGLNTMTMLLSRAELVKESGAVSDQEWSQWTGLYNRLFDILEPVLSSTFPGPVNSGDDMYVWQFLAAVGIGASPEQQQRLVLAVKDRVMDTVSQSKALPIEMSRQRLSNVNLFMKAIGLDVEMLG